MIKLSNKTFIIFMLIITSLITFSKFSYSNDVDDSLRDHLEQLQLQANPKIDDTDIHTLKTIFNFYEQRGFANVWTSKQAKQEKIDLINSLEKSKEHGLNPEDYHLTKINNLIPKKSVVSKIKLEILLSDAYFLYASHLYLGKVNPKSFDAEWHIVGRTQKNFGEYLDKALKTHAIQDSFNQLTPRHVEYGLLKKELEKVQASALNNVQITVDKILVNLERWRWLPQDFGEKYIVVNIPSFKLNVYEKEKSVLDMKVIVGRPYRNTPVFSDKLTYIVVNPRWNVTRNIAVLDKLPLLKKNPLSLKKQGIQIYGNSGGVSKVIDPQLINWKNVTAKNFKYQLVQSPGKNNALGKVKFMFPNAYNVYLHDTPDKLLFEKEVRTFSSGCIRLEKPLDLMDYVLKGEPDTVKQFAQETLKTSNEKTISLGKAIPIYLLYWTVVIDSNGQLSILNDVYSRDDKVLKALQEKP